MCDTGPSSWATASWKAITSPRRSRSSSSNDGPSEGHSDAEAINLGIAATGPRQYYYRIKRVALALKPDTIVIFVYAGNDFIQVRFDDFAMPALAEELPVPSILGTIAPRTNWLVSNRLGLSELGRNNREVPGENELLAEWAATPTPELTARVARHMQQYYYPKLSEETIREILARGGEPMRLALAQRKADHQTVAGWLLAGVIDWETGTWSMPKDAQEAERMIDPKVVDDTLGWLVAAEELAKAHGVKLFVALAPVGIGDPEYVEFWKPWPQYFSYTLVGRCPPQTTGGGAAPARHAGHRLARSPRWRSRQLPADGRALDRTRHPDRRRPRGPGTASLRDGIRQAGTRGIDELPTRGSKIDMIGAIVTTAALAFLASTLTTIGNFAIARDFPHYQNDQDDMVFYSPLAIRFMQYRITTNIFYYQSLCLWALLVVLVAFKLLSSLLGI